MLCPVDDAELKAGSFSGYEIHRCPQCLGASVNVNVLRDVRAYVALELHKQQAPNASMRPCPKDGTAMKSLIYKSVPLCACPQCLRLWLDKGELARLLELAGPARQPDLSTIGQRLPDVPSHRSANSIGDIGNILELSADTLSLIGKLLD